MYACLRILLCQIDQTRGKWSPSPICFGLNVNFWCCRFKLKRLQVCQIRSKWMMMFGSSDGWSRRGRNHKMITFKHALNMKRSTEHHFKLVSYVLFFFEISISILEELATVQRNVLSIRWFELDALNARNESEKLKKELSSNRPLQATRGLSFLQMV